VPGTGYSEIGDEFDLPGCGRRHGRLRRCPFRGERHRRPAHPRGRRDAHRGGRPSRAARRRRAS